jgi:hypothetical protein
MLNNYSDEYSFICSHATKYYDNNSRKEKEKKSLIKYNDILKTNLVGSQVLIKKERLINSGYFDEDFQASQDHDMWCRVIKKYGSAKKLNHYLYKCNIDSSIDRISNKKIFGLRQFYNKHKKDMNIYIKAFNFLRLIKMYLNRSKQ